MSDLHSHVRDVSALNITQHCTDAQGRPIEQEQQSDGTRRFAEVISRRLTAARAGDERSWRWIELLLQGSGLAGLPGRFPACEGTFTEDLAAILSKTSVQSGCTSHKPECRVFFFNPSMEGLEPLESNGSCIPYVSNPDGKLEESPNSTIERVIVGVHGTGTNTEPQKAPPGQEAFSDYYNITYALTQAPDPQVEMSRTAVICVQFQSDQSAGKAPYTDCWPNVAWWSGTAWKDGMRSANPPPFGGVSSFDFLDAIIQRASFKYPNAKKFIVMGHSAGGQAVQRYALLDAGIGVWLWQSRGARLRYLCYNPFYYTFLTPERYYYTLLSNTPLWKCDSGQNIAYGGDGWGWGLPALPGWNDYPYGLGWGGKQIASSVSRATKVLNFIRNWGYPETYGWTSDDAILRHAYINKDIYHFHATQDDDHHCVDNMLAAGNLATTQQGYTRTQRFETFRESFKWFNHQNWANQRCVGIADLPHDGSCCGCTFCTHCAGLIYAKEESLDKMLGILG